MQHFHCKANIFVGLAGEMGEHADTGSTGDFSAPTKTLLGITLVRMRVGELQKIQKC